MVRRGEKVQNAAAVGKLPRALHLVGAGIAAAQQRVLNVLNGIAAAALDGEGRPAQGIGGHRALHEAGDGSRDHRGSVLGEGVQYGDAPLLGLAGGRLGGIKGEIPHPQAQRRLAQHGAQVVGEVLRRGVVRADDKEGQAAPLPQGGGQIGPMHRRKPGNERRKSSALQQTGEGGGFLVFKYLVDQDVHDRAIVPSFLP